MSAQGHCEFVVFRSDGRKQYLPAQSNKPNEDGMLVTYNRVEFNDAECIAWRRELGDRAGVAYAHDLCLPHILKKFPTSYVLWGETTENPSNPDEVKYATYLYGHPSGRRFISPEQFWPHLLWLLGGGGAKCRCEICSWQVRKSRKEKKRENSRNTNDENQELSVGYKALPKNREQEFDCEANNKFLYRPGEMVWIDKKPGLTIGIICKRQLVNSKATYLIQPLSHPLYYPPTNIRDEDKIRPWLTWTIPRQSDDRITSELYEEVPWEAARESRFDDHIRDYGSILAAEAVERAYTFFDRLPSPDKTRIFYSGMFLGAEKIWVGDALRLQHSRIAVLVVQQLTEKRTRFPGKIPEIVGDVYEFVEIPVPFVAGMEWPIAGLPARMAADLLFRREAAVRAKYGIWCQWKLVGKNVTKGLNDILGRWYETRTMVPFLAPDKYSRGLQNGLTFDATKWLGGRCEGTQGMNRRMKDRIECLGKAVPPGMTISCGLNGPPEDNIFPPEPQTRYQITDEERAK